MKSTVYILEVYEPKAVKNVWVTFQSSSPFMNLHVGDILNPGLWPDSHSPMKALQIVGLEHAIWESDDAVKPKLMVYSKEVDSLDFPRFS